MTTDTTEYVVEGMTCEHCVRAVRDEVWTVAGVRGVEVELDSGRLAVTGANVADDAVRAAVDEAGYAVAP